MSILTINGGSSSIRFAVHDDGEAMKRVLDGKMHGIGKRPGIRYTDESGKSRDGPCLDGNADSEAAVAVLLDWLQSQPRLRQVRAVGHRLVHGMAHTDPRIIDDALLDELHRIAGFVPEHLPLEIALIEALRERRPDLVQVACFDTAFHESLPRIASLLPIPRRYHDEGVRKYGFHGLSCSYLMQELARLGDPAAISGRVVLAHLGNGASITAVRDGCSVDTSMGFTPAAGLVMGSRSGDLDPGLVAYLAHAENMTPARFQQMVNHESGLKGLSGCSSDMGELLDRQASDPCAAEAIAVFCYQARKWIGAYAAVLGGVDTLVFSGGIGENLPVIRERICEELGFLGVELDHSRNAGNRELISTDLARVPVRVIPTDEEIVIARSVAEVLRDGSREGA